MKYILGMIIALFLVFPSSAYSQQPGQEKTNQPVKVKSGQQAPAVKQPAPAKAESPAAAKKEFKAAIAVINGDCMIKPKTGPQAGKWVKVTQPGFQVSSGDIIIVQKGYVEISLGPESTVKMEQGCEVMYTQSRERVRPLYWIKPGESYSKIKVTKGNILAKIAKHEVLRHFVVFETPSAVAGVRGTTVNLNVTQVCAGSGTCTNDSNLSSAEGNLEGYSKTSETTGQIGRTSFSLNPKPGQTTDLKITTTTTGTAGAANFSTTSGNVSLTSGGIQANLPANGTINVTPPSGANNATTFSVPAAAEGQTNPSVSLKDAATNTTVNLQSNQSVEITQAPGGGTQFNNTSSSTTPLTVSVNNVPVDIPSGQNVELRTSPSGTVLQTTGTVTVGGQTYSAQPGEKLTITITPGGEQQVQKQTCDTNPSTGELINCH